MDTLPAALQLYILELIRDGPNMKKCRKILGACSTSNDFQTLCTNNINALWTSAGFDANDPNKTLANFSQKCFAEHSRELIQKMIELIARGKEIQFHPNFGGFSGGTINTEPDFSNIEEITNVENVIREYVRDVFEYLNKHEYLLYKEFGTGNTPIDVHITTIRRFISSDIGLFDNIDRMATAVEFLIRDFQRVWDD